MVQIRDAAGDLVTIPHSSVINVVNQSRNWSRVDYRVPVDPAADVAKAVDVVRSTIESLASEDRWRGVAVLPVESIGIDELSKDWAIVRASIRTAPLRQFEFRRELNAHVLAAFGAANIPLGAQLPATAS
jgi:small conductance mechanosensitive channel